MMPSERVALALFVLTLVLLTPLIFLRSGGFIIGAVFIIAFVAVVVFGLRRDYSEVVMEKLSNMPWLVSAFILSFIIGYVVYVATRFNLTYGGVAFWLTLYATVVLFLVSELVATRRG